MEEEKKARVGVTGKDGPAGGVETGTAWGGEWDCSGRLQVSVLALRAKADGVAPAQVLSSSLEDPARTLRLLSCEDTPG